MKTTRVWTPVSLYDIPGLEHWLEEKANEGLFPINLGSWSSFRPGALPHTRFRVEVWGKMGTEPAPEQLELYEAQGWRYAFPIGRAYFLFYTEDPGAPDLYTDYESRAFSLERLERQLRRFVWRKRIIYLAVIAVTAWLFFKALQFDVQPDFFVRLPLLPLYAGDPVLLLFVVYGLFCWSSSRRDRRMLRRTYQALKQGLPPPPSPGPSRRIVWENRISLFLLLPMTVLVLYLYFGNSALTTCPVEEFTSPYVSLRDLEQVPLGPYETIYRENSGLSSENVAERSYSLLAPVWYEVNQDLDALQPGQQPNYYSPDPQGGQYTYSPNLDQTRFRLLFSSLARPVAMAQLDQYRLVNLHWTYQEVDVLGLDFAVLATPEEDRVWQMAALGRGRDVAVFRYAGQERLEDHLDTLAALLDQ